MSEKPHITKESKTASGITRRGVLKAVGANALGFLSMGAIAKMGMLEEPIKDVQETPIEPEVQKPEEQEQIATIEHSDRMHALVSGYLAQVRLSRTEILFTDIHHIPVGKPVPFAEYDIPYQEKDAEGKLVTKLYKLTPGEVYEEGPLKGFLKKGIAPEWVEYEQMKYSEAFGIPFDELYDSNIEPDVAAALANPREPALRESIIKGERKTLMDIVHYFADKQVSEHDTRSRLQYLNEELRFDETDLNLPAVTQANLLYLFPGVVGKESKYDIGIPKNSDTACSAFQITDKVRVKYGFAAGANLTFQEQVTVAGKFIADSYRQFFGVVQEKDPNAMSTIRKCFSSEEKFQEFFVVPCLLNLYNCGVDLMGKAVKAFEIEVLAKRDSLQKYDGYDLFLELADFAHGKSFGTKATYGDDAREYVPYVIAYAIALNANVSSNVRVASSDF